MSHIANTLWYEARAEWLDAEGRKEGDVMTDGGGEFILLWGEEMYDKIYLPDNLQSTNDSADNDL